MKTILFTNFLRATEKSPLKITVLHSQGLLTPRILPSFSPFEVTAVCVTSKARNSINRHFEGAQ